MKKTFLFGSLLIFVVFFLQGCSTKTMESEKILDDLKASSYAEYVNETFESMRGYLRDCDGEHEMQCEIDDVAKFDDKQIYTCLITSSNHALSVKELLKVTYEKEDQWRFSDYTIAKTEQRIITGISEEWYTAKATEYFEEKAADEYSVYTPNVKINSAEQKMNETGTDGVIDLNCTVTNGILTTDCLLEISTKDGKTGKDAICRISDEQYTWDLNALSGKKWSDKNYNFVHIVSVDEENNTMQVSYKDYFNVSTIGSYEPTECSVEMYTDCIKIKHINMYIYPDTSTTLWGLSVYPEGFITNNDYSVTMDAYGNLKDQDGNIILTKEQVEKKLAEEQ